MEYAAGHVQIKMLRLKSENVRQKVTYNCFNSQRQMTVLSDDDMELPMSEVATTVKDGCTNVSSFYNTLFVKKVTKKVRKSFEVT